MELLAQPLRLGGRQLRNRLVLTPHLGRLAPPRLARYLAERAAGGIAMAVLPAGQGLYTASIYPQEIQESSDEPRDVRAELAPLAEAVHGHGAVAIGQLYHPGAERSWDTLDPAIAPSPVRADATGAMPHALTRRELRALVRSYVAAGETVLAAGLDGVELHSAHGYLLNRFLSPYYNRRTDAYGGSADRRARLLLEILTGLRDRLGPEPLIGVRLPVAEEVDGGLTTEELAELAARIAPLVSYLSLTLGNHDGVRAGAPATAYTAPWLVGPAPAAPAARRIRAAAGRPVLVTGRITTAETARELLRSGAADLVGLARALIADPRFAERATTGRDAEIVECIGCNECVRTPFACPVNPDAGREGRLAPAPRRGRRVVVAGAGPAGVEAAIRAAGRGYEVTVLDAAAEVGGALCTLVATPLLARWAPALDLLRRRLAASRVVPRLGMPVTAERIAELEPDVLVVATGARPLPAAFPGLSTSELLAGVRPAAGVPVVVVGGGEPHLEPLLVADLLAGEGRPVTLLTEHQLAGPDLEVRTRHALLAQLLRRGVAIVPMTRATGWDGGHVSTVHRYTGAAARLPAGAVVHAHGRQAAPLELPLPDRLVCHVVGDALAPRRLSHAALEGARFGAAL